MWGWGLEPCPSAPYLHSFNSNLIKASILYKKKRWIARTGEWLRRTEKTGAEEMTTVKLPGDDRQRRTLV